MFFSLIKAKATETYFNKHNSFQQGVNQKMVGLSRLELPTSPLSGVRSNQAELQTRILFTLKYIIYKH